MKKDEQSERLTSVPQAQESLELDSTEGDALWSERQKLDKRRMTWPWTLGLGALALGWSVWTRLEWQSRQHAITLRVVPPTRSGDARQASVLEILMPDAPVSSDERYIEGPLWEVTARSNRFRPADKPAWIEGTASENAVLQEQLLGRPVMRREAGGVRARWLRSQWLGLPPGDHEATVDITARFNDDNGHAWSGQTSASIAVAIPTPTLPPPAKIIRGIDRVQHENGNQNWSDVPAPGQPNFPLVVEEVSGFSLRALPQGYKLGPKPKLLEADDWFKPISPYWKGGGMEFSSSRFSHTFQLPPEQQESGAYKRVQVSVQARDHEIVRGIPIAKVREGEASSAQVWLFVRPKSRPGMAPPPFDEAAATALESIPTSTPAPPTPAP